MGTFDRSAFEPGYALRCTIGVTIPLVTAAAVGKPTLGVPAAIGAFITGFTSLQGSYRTRLAAVIAAAVGMSITSFVGAVAAHSTPLLVAVTAVAGYVVGAFSQLGPTASTVALNSFVAFVIFSSQAIASSAAAEDSALVFSGGLIQAVLIVLAWPTARMAAERVALASVYRNLAGYAHQISEGSPALPPITPFAAARQILTDPQPFANSSELARLNRLLEDSEIIRKRLGSLAATSTAQHRAPVSDVCAAAARHLNTIADLLTGAREDLKNSPLPYGDSTSSLGGVSELVARLHDATEAASMIASGRLPKILLLSRVRPAPYVQNHIEWFGRDAIRFAVVLAIAMLLSRYFAADRGYWIPLTAALVLKPDLRTTFVRGVARVGGTLLGAIVATLLITFARNDPVMQIIGILAAAAAAYLTFNPNYALFTVAITSFVVMVLRMRGLPGTTTVETRLVDTLVGGALAMIGYAVLPTWVYKRTRPLLADLIDAQRQLADAILHAYVAPSQGATQAIDKARTRVWKARTTVEASIDRARQEPHRAHTIGPARALRILSATQRFALANLALETAVETQPTLNLPNLDAFTAALDETMSELAAALRDSRQVELDARLQQITASIETELAATTDVRRRFVLERLRGYSEAAFRIARLIGVEKIAARVPTGC